MPADFTADLPVIVDAVIALAKTHNDTAENQQPWLAAQLAAATTAFLSGAITIKSLALGGMNATGDSEINCAALINVLTKAINKLSGADTDTVGGVLYPRFGCGGIPI